MDTDEIVRIGQLASALEVCAHPKPGNVHRYSDLKEETFEQFIAGAVVIGPSLQKAAKRGNEVGRGKIRSSQVRVGELIREGVEMTNLWTEENTNLGVLLLLVPLSVAAGVTIVENSEFSIGKLRKNVSRALSSTDSDDSLDVYEAIRVANAGGLGDIDRLSVKGDDSREEIEEEDISLYEVMEISSGWDTISREWVTDMEITFEEGFPLLKKFHQEKGNLNTAIVQTFLRLLSDHPDSFIQRKHGQKISEKTSEKASSILEKGGMFTSEGRAAIWKFDEQLREEDINPGTTADLIASSLMVSFLDGLKPRLRRFS